MDLTVGLVGWTADGTIKFDTPTALAQQPKLLLSLKKLPNADLTGSLTGDFAMSGALQKSVALSLTLTGKTTADASGKIVRGATRVTGTATAGGSTFAVDLTH